MRCRRLHAHRLRAAAAATLVAVAAAQGFTPSVAGETLVERPAAASVGESHAEFVLDVPVRPFSAAPGRSMHRPIDLTRAEGGIRLRAQGGGTIDYDLALEGRDRAGLDIVVHVVGSADCRLRASRQRASATASLSSTISATGAIAVTQEGFSPGAMEIDVRNVIVPTSGTFTARLAPVRWLGGRVVSRVLDSQIPSLTRQTEREMQREIAAELAAGIRKAVAHANQAADSTARVLSRDSSMMVRFHAATVADRARLHFRVHEDAGSPGDEAEPPPSTKGDDSQCMVHIADGLPNLLGRRLQGVTLVETDFRDLCLEPLGLVPDFDTDVTFGGPPAIVHFSDENPLAVIIGPASLSFDVRLAGFTDCDGRRFETPCRIAARYESTGNEGLLRLTRRGRPLAVCDDPLAAAALDAVAVRFFCASAESTEVTAVKEVLASGDMTLDGIEFGNRWLTLTIGYDPQALLRKILP